MTTKDKSTKVKHHIALNPGVLKQIRILALEFDVFPGDIIEGLVHLAKDIRAFKEAFEFQEGSLPASKVYSDMARWMEEHFHGALESREEREAYEKAKAAGPKAASEYMLQRIAKAEKVLQDRKQSKE